MLTIFDAHICVVVVCCVLQPLRLCPEVFGFGACSRLKALIAKELKLASTTSFRILTAACDYSPPTTIAFYALYPGIGEGTWSGVRVFTHNQPSAIQSAFDALASISGCHQAISTTALVSAA